jgi:uncharacterized protein YyaL (SSP411 family)
MPRATLLVAALAAVAAVGPGTADEKPKARPANRLAREASPYLLQHAHNPVDWYPWGEEAFARAKKEGKLVFLSVGYSSCHWCHVMERESFADGEVARILNEHFVCIKVDREERPDVDQVYMAALQAFGGSGGWPLSMFLTADGKPVAGGTYWPREDRTSTDPDTGRSETARGFKSVLKAVRQFQAEQPDELRRQADRLADATRAELAGAARGRAIVPLDRNLVAEAVHALRERFDKEHGGFGSPARGFRGPKFPTPPALLLLQHEAARGGDKDLGPVLRLTLDRMARGGIYDHLGGGFHRYSTERTWAVPHFEKMLYDNAQLLEVYAAAYRETKDPLYRRVLEQTVAFVGRELTAPGGGFYSALDADSEGEEGRFYVWAAREIDAALADKADAALFKEVYGADGPPNFEGESHVLRLPRPLADQAAARKTTGPELEARLAALRRKLLDARARRPRPLLDTKILTGWNGEMIAGLAAAGRALDDRAAVAAAARAADFVLKELRTREGRLLRSYAVAPGRKGEGRLNAYLDDYAYLVHGLLALHDATGEARWLDEAKALADTMVRLHADPEAGGFFYTSNDHEQLFARAKDQYDGAQPSGNSAAAQDLVRLWVKTGDRRYAAEAERTFKALAGPLKLNPVALPGLADALAEYLRAKK